MEPKRPASLPPRKLGVPKNPPRPRRGCRLRRDEQADAGVRREAGSGGFARGARGQGGCLHRARRGGRSRRQNGDRKSTRLNSSHVAISYAVFCLKKKKKKKKKQKRGKKERQER